MRFVLALLLVSIGCAAGKPTTNPSFSISRDKAVRELTVAAEHKKQLDRPLVIMAGFLDLGVGTFVMEQRLKQVVDGPILRIGYFDCTNFQDCRKRAIDRIDARFGIVSDSETVEVDVIGLSMGGLVARHAAVPDAALGKRLKIRNLYTLSSPLTGAKRAAQIPWAFTSMIRDMRPGSAFYDELAKHPADYATFSYTMLNDDTVGGEYASLPGEGVWWLSPPPLSPAHASIAWDRRILLDIARRLRHEPPIATTPPTPLPDNP